MTPTGHTPTQTRTPRVSPPHALPTAVDPTHRKAPHMASTSSTPSSATKQAPAPATRKATKQAPTHDQPQAPTSEQVDAVRERRRQLED